VGWEVVKREMEGAVKWLEDGQTTSPPFYPIPESGVWCFSFLPHTRLDSPGVCAMLFSSGEMAGYECPLLA
jgi:hypothetical protein